MKYLARILSVKHGPGGMVRKRLCFVVAACLSVLNIHTIDRMGNGSFGQAIRKKTQFYPCENITKFQSSVSD